MKGYWNDPEATAETLVDGWLRTGDLGKMDSEGYITVVDRMKDMLISGGLNVYPAEIEKVICALPGMIDVAVIGTKDEKWGEVPLAVIYADHSIDCSALESHCRENLSDYKRPHYLIQRSEPLPRNMSGKLLKRVLRDDYKQLPTDAVLLKKQQ